MTSDEERYWESIAAQYDVTDEVSNLENGFWGTMARPVLRKYLELTERVNRDNTWYVRRTCESDLAQVTARVAASMGVTPDEVVLTRNATEALTNLVLGYNKLRPGDAVLYSDHDYDSVVTAVEQLRHTRGVTLAKISIPEPATYQSVIDAYEEALNNLKNCRLVLLTHVGHRSGLIPPVREIAEMARKYGADVIVDAAHSWGQIDFEVTDLGADFVGVNLHKWIGAPIGNGVMYVRKDRIPDIDPYLNEAGASQTDIRARVHTATVNFAAVLTVPTAIDFHGSIGTKRLETRLRMLRDRWVQHFVDDPRIQILTPQDSRMYAGITSFRFTGKTSKADNSEIARRLAEEHGVLTVYRQGLSKGCCVRVTPAAYTTTADVDKLAAALRKMLADA